MVGTVVVSPPGGPVDAPAAVNARGAKELGQWLAEGRAAKRRLETAPTQRARNADGTTTWRVGTGVTTEHTDVLAFGPGDTRIEPGDRVTFVNDSQTPHTVTFPGTQPAPPKNALDPREAQVTPGPSPQTLDATRLFNTGELPPDTPPGGGPSEATRSFTFVVPAAGKYSFYCILHVGSGMGGTLTAG
jgi:plastocyanin